MAVGDVVHDLADGPSAFAIGRVPLSVVEAVDGVAELAGKLCKGADGAHHIVFCGKRGFDEAAYRDNEDRDQ